MEKLVLLFLLSNIAFSTVQNLSIVTIPDGTLLGATYLSPNNVSYYGYRGIPYAAPPLGPLRFEPPQAPEPWDNIWDATNDGKTCITDQYFDYATIESEDCLFVNVYVPVEKNEKLPVMFWIHGGGYTQGNAMKSLYGPDYFMEAGVILVSTQYRLGPFGFLSTQDDVLPGNIGLKDQLLALNWTKNNIEYFGGDPEQITIFGESAGGSSVGLHLVSKPSKGLFRAAIVESGAALNAWSIDPEPSTVAFQVGNLIPNGNFGNDSKLLKEFLKNSSVEDIVNAELQVLQNSYFHPTLEPEHEGAFLTEAPYGLLESGDFSQVPIMIGITAQESLLFIANLDNAQALAHLFDISPQDLITADMFPNDTDVDVVTQKIKQLYLDGNETFSENLLALVNYYSDANFNLGIIKHAELASKFVPVYLYQFAYYGRPMLPPFIERSEKATHAAELPFIFNMEILQSDDSQDILMQQLATTLWTNVAKYLNPTPESATSILNVTWPQYDDNLYYLNINATLEVRQDIRPNTYLGWNEIYEEYARKPYITF